MEKSHQPCPCGTSSDGYTQYTPERGYCFVCGKTFWSKEEEKDESMTASNPVDTTGYTYEYLDRRGLTKETHEFFGVKSQIDPTGKPHSVVYPFPNGAGLVRVLDPKTFYSVGNMSNTGGLFADKFVAGQSRAVTICEGGDDAMAVYQMLGKYPVYAVKSSSSAAKDCARDFEYLNSFDKIYLSLDNDPPGDKATAAVSALFDISKVYHVKTAPFKAPHDMLEAGKAKEFRNAWFNARRFQPDDIVSSYQEIEDVLRKRAAEPSHPWPFPSLTEATDGIKRSRSYLFSGLEGIGKTEVFHAVAHHLVKTDPDSNIGVIHLEEPTDESVKKIVGYEVQRPTVFSDSGFSIDDILREFKKLTGRDDRVVYYHHFGSDDVDRLLQRIRFMAVGRKCKYIFFDNITITVQGKMDSEVTSTLDYFSAQLEMLVKELDIVLFFISHENDAGQTRNSRNISKVCDVWIKLHRDVNSDNDFVKRLITVAIQKGRGCKKTGPVCKLIYNPDTGTLSEYSEELPV